MDKSAYLIWLILLAGCATNDATHKQSADAELFWCMGLCHFIEMGGEAETKSRTEKKEGKNDTAD